MNESRAGEVHREHDGPGGGVSAPRFSADEIKRAIKHYRRAILALRTDLSAARYAIDEGLLEHLQEDLIRLEDVLERRRADAFSD